MFSKTEGGIIVTPAALNHRDGLLCSYPYDPHSLGRTCSPPGVNWPTCVPGCAVPGGRCNWCDEPNCQYYGGCAFRREQLQDMLRDFKRRKQPDRGYNELIVGTEHFLSTLPSGVEAFFYLKTPRCQGSGCEQKARAGRATFAADYSLGPGEAPLLSFDPGNWEAPFAVPEE